MVEATGGPSDRLKPRLSGTLSHST